ncbi:hypothetical protein [Aquimarina latercula]|uniref:hypothetical protein n=1 Tax=Aquimarina latercula TaxID=987 RepID=UPI0004097D1F|nr:hypothetical protein [Aquimarina latercula]
MRSTKEEELKKHTVAFKQSVVSLQKDLEYLAEHSKVSDRFLERRNKIHSYIIAYHNYIEKFISEMEKDHLFLQKVITSLKAICVMHGIVDFPRFLEWGKPLLVCRANELQQEGKFRLPAMFNEKLRSYSKEEQHTIDTILFKEVNCQLRELLGNIRKNKTNFVYGVRTQRNKAKKEEKKATIKR